MVQRYSMIFWKGPMPDTDAESLTPLVSCVLHELAAFSNMLYPRYLPAWRKRDVKEFILDEANLFPLIEQGLKQERKYSPKLGVSLSFFTSLDEERSAKLAFSVGYNSPGLSNAVVINLPYEGFTEIHDRADEFFALFQRLVVLFAPYYAFVDNSADRPDKAYWLDKPCRVHWLNYYSRDTVKLIGKTKFRRLPDVTEAKNGIFLRLQQAPLDITSPEYFLRQEIYEKILGI